MTAGQEIARAGVRRVLLLTLHLEPAENAR